MESARFVNPEPRRVHGVALYGIVYLTWWGLYYI
jgi:hypothetical protein